MIEYPECTPGERERLRHNQCPDCGNYGFHDGPRGGLSQNIFCANPHCRSGFNLGPQLVIAQRIGQGRTCYYPPRVHALVSGGRPACMFTLRQVWPRGHTATGEIDCPDCLAQLRRTIETLT